MYSIELRKKILPYLDIACGGCRVRRSVIDHWIRSGDLIQAINKYKNYPGVNTLMMEIEIPKIYKEYIK